jgi:hypothetical protein
VHEIVPVALGALVALACGRVTSPRLRRMIFAPLVLLAAVSASLVNGEQPGWPFFLAADVCFALAGAVAVRVCQGPLSRRLAMRLAARSR